MSLSIWKITSPVAISLWFVGAGLATYWFQGRRRDAIEMLEPSPDHKLSAVDADKIRWRLIGDGFLAGGAVVLLFQVLRLIFG